MSDHKTINLPNGLLSESLKKGVGSISFKVTGDCTFCYSDPTPCFPTFMAAGTYTKTDPPTTYGPFMPDADGTVAYNAVVSTPPPRTTAGIDGTPCSITVSS
jgi:hypothetical protein